MKINPKHSFITATRELINKTDSQYEVLVAGVRLKTHPDVFNPKVFFSSEWFANNISSLIRGEEILIEIGCGSGIVGIKAAKGNPDLRVLATDINIEATKLTKENAAINKVSDLITVFNGDVLDGLPKNVKARTIFWSLPFGYLEPEEELTGRDTQTFDPGYRAIRKLFSTARSYMKQNGRLLLGFSSDIGHLELFEEIAKEHSFSLKLIASTKGVEKESVSMEIYEAK
jgi:methylase of polypeptide subunit release factors